MNETKIYCPLCFQPMKVYDGPNGYGCYCYGNHAQKEDYVWHEVPDWFLKKLKQK